MKKIIIQFLSAVLLICLSLPSFAATVDYDKKCNVTVTYSKNEYAFCDLEIKIYRVSDCNFEKVSPFNSYPVSVSGIKSQSEWNSVATTLSGFITADNIPPYKTVKTDADGNAVFKDIDVGLYYIAGVVAQSESGIYNFFDTMLFLPVEGDGEYIYDISIRPKCDEIVKSEKTYSITKLWKDDGYIDRPKSVEVDILKDGIAVDTVVLNSDNNWQHTFKTTDVKSNWSVVEKNISPDYTVTVTEKEASFVIVNTIKDTKNPPSDVPSTGDSSHIELYSVIFCVSGLLIIVCGIGIRRKENAEQE